MRKSTSIHLCIIVSILSFLPGALADDPQRQPQQISVSLSAYNERKLFHDKHEPLHLELSLGNPAAQNAQMEIDCTKRLKAHPKPNASARQLELIEKMANSTSLPSVTIGSEQEPLPKLISFNLVDSLHKASAIEPRMMAWSDKIVGATVLDAKNTVHLSYGLDPKVLTQLANGPYELKVYVGNHNKAGSEQGRFQSNSVVLTLTDKPTATSKDEEEIKLYRLGQFYLEDKQYDQVLVIAKRIDDLHPGSATASELRGDVYAAQDQLKDAQTAYQSALESLNKQFGEGYKPHPNTVIEPPTELMQKLSNVIKALYKSSSQ